NNAGVEWTANFFRAANPEVVSSVNKIGVENIFRLKTVSAESVARFISLTTPETYTHAINEFGIEKLAQLINEYGPGWTADVVTSRYTNIGLDVAPNSTIVNVVNSFIDNGRVTFNNGFTAKEFAKLLVNSGLSAQRIETVIREQIRFGNLQLNDGWTPEQFAMKFSQSIQEDLSLFIKNLDPGVNTPLDFEQKLDWLLQENFDLVSRFTSLVNPIDAAKFFNQLGIENAVMSLQSNPQLFANLINTKGVDVAVHEAMIMVSSQTHSEISHAGIQAGIPIAVAKTTIVDTAPRELINKLPKDHPLKEWAKSIGENDPTITALRNNGFDVDIIKEDKLNEICRLSEGDQRIIKDNNGKIVSATLPDGKILVSEDAPLWVARDALSVHELDIFMREVSGLLPSSDINALEKSALISDGLSILEYKMMAQYLQEIDPSASEIILAKAQQELNTLNVKAGKEFTLEGFSMNSLKSIKPKGVSLEFLNEAHIENLKVIEGNLGRNSDVNRENIGERILEVIEDIAGNNIGYRVKWTKNIVEKNLISQLKNLGADEGTINRAISEINKADMGNLGQVIDGIIIGASKLKAVDMIQVTTPELDLTSGKKIPIQVTLERHSVKIGEGNVLYNSITIDSSDKIEQLKERARNLRNLPEKERIYHIVDMVRENIEYPHDWSKERLEEEARKQIKLSEAVDKGVGICKVFSALYAVLAQEADLGVAPQAGKATNIIRSDTNEKLFKAYDLGEDVYHAWDETELSDGSFIPVDPTTGLVGVGKGIDVFREANYKEWVNIEVKDLPEDVTLDRSELLFSPGEGRISKLTYLHSKTTIDLETGEETPYEYKGELKFTLEGITGFTSGYAERVEILDVEVPEGFEIKRIKPLESPGKFFGRESPITNKGLMAHMENTPKEELTTGNIAQLLITAASKSEFAERSFNVLIEKYEQDPGMIFDAIEPVEKSIPESDIKSTKISEIEAVLRNVVEKNLISQLKNLSADEGTIKNASNEIRDVSISELKDTATRILNREIIAKELRSGEFKESPILAENADKLAKNILSNLSTSGKENSLRYGLIKVIYPDSKTVFDPSQGAEVEVPSEKTKYVFTLTEVDHARILKEPKIFIASGDGELVKRMGDIQIKDAEIWDDIGGLFYRRDLYKDAIMACNKAIEINPENMDFRLHEAQYLTKAGMFDEAIKAYDKIIEVNSENEIAWNNKAYNHLQLGEIDAAKESIEKALEIKPDYVKALTTKAEILLKSGDNEKAIEWADKAFNIDPEYVYPLIIKNLAYNNLNRFREAAECCNKILEIEPELREFLYDEIEFHQSILDRIHDIDVASGIEVRIKLRQSLESIKESCNTEIQLVKREWKAIRSKGEELGIKAISNASGLIEEARKSGDIKMPIPFKLNPENPNHVEKFNRFFRDELINVYKEILNLSNEQCRKLEKVKIEFRRGNWRSMHDSVQNGIVIYLSPIGSENEDQARLIFGYGILHELTHGVIRTLSDSNKVFSISGADYVSEGYAIMCPFLIAKKLKKNPWFDALGRLNENIIFIQKEFGLDPVDESYYAQLRLAKEGSFRDYMSVEPEISDLTPEDLEPYGGTAELKEIEKDIRNSKNPEHEVARLIASLGSEDKDIRKNSLEILKRISPVVGKERIRRLMNEVRILCPGIGTTEEFIKLKEMLSADELGTTSTKAESDPSSESRRSHPKIIGYSRDVINKVNALLAENLEFYGPLKNLTKQVNELTNEEREELREKHGIQIVEDLITEEHEKLRAQGITLMQFISRKEINRMVRDRGDEIVTTFHGIVEGAMVPVLVVDRFGVIRVVGDAPMYLVYDALGHEGYHILKDALTGDKYKEVEEDAAISDGYHILALKEIAEKFSNFPKLKEIVLAVMKQELDTLNTKFNENYGLDEFNEDILVGLADTTGVKIGYLREAHRKEILRLIESELSDLQGITEKNATEKLVNVLKEVALKEWDIRMEWTRDKRARKHARKHVKEMVPESYWNKLREEGGSVEERINEMVEELKEKLKLREYRIISAELSGEPTEKVIKDFIKYAETILNDKLAGDSRGYFKRLNVTIYDSHKTSHDVEVIRDKDGNKFRLAVTYHETAKGLGKERLRGRRYRKDETSGIYFTFSDDFNRLIEQAEEEAKKKKPKKIREKPGKPSKAQLDELFNDKFKLSELPEGRMKEFLRNVERRIRELVEEGFFYGKVLEEFLDDVVKIVSEEERGETLGYEFKLTYRRDKPNEVEVYVERRFRSTESGEVETASVDGRSVTQSTEERESSPHVTSSIDGRSVTQSTRAWRGADSISKTIKRRGPFATILNTLNLQGSVDAIRRELTRNPYYNRFSRKRKARFLDALDSLGIHLGERRDEGNRPTLLPPDMGELLIKKIGSEKLSEYEKSDIFNYVERIITEKTRYDGVVVTDETPYIETDLTGTLYIPYTVLENLQWLSEFLSEEEFEQRLIDIARHEYAHRVGVTYQDIEDAVESADKETLKKIAGKLGIPESENLEEDLIKKIQEYQANAQALIKYETPEEFLNSVAALSEFMLLAYYGEDGFNREVSREYLASSYRAVRDKELDEILERSRELHQTMLMNWAIELTNKTENELTQIKSDIKKLEVTEIKEYISEYIKPAIKKALEINSEMRQDLERGEGIEKVEEFRLRDIIDEAVEGAEAEKITRLSSENISLYGIKYLVRERILTELVHNSRKYGASEIIINACEKDGNVVISVTDNGIGIPKENLGRIFERGYMVPEAKTVKGFGRSGEGLANALESAKWLGGNIEAQSDGLGKGTTFIVTIPKRVESKGFVDIFPEKLSTDRHDFGAKLRAIGGFVSLLEDENLTDEQKSAKKKILDSANRINTYIDKNRDLMVEEIKEIKRRLIRNFTKELEEFDDNRFYERVRDSRLDVGHLAYYSV
ncbi:MAG: hypothetical protein DRO76_03310, partial [Candidatus Altiarchaeales archaeon]